MVLKAHPPVLYILFTKVTPPGFQVTSLRIYTATIVQISTPGFDCLLDFRSVHVSYLPQALAVSPFVDLSIKSFHVNQASRSNRRLALDSILSLALILGQQHLKAIIILLA